MSGNVFISWSGNTSKAVAEVLREWLPSVIQAVKPWMSSEDIDKGSRWSPEISGKLKETRIGIICLTPDNLNAPWILFEAGALSKTVEDSFVCPFLFRVEQAEVKGPLAQFQLTKADKGDTRKLLGTINKALGESALRDEQLSRVFEKWWPDLEGQLQAIGEANLENASEPQRTDRDILEEILSVARGQARQLKEQEERSRMERIANSMIGQFGRRSGQVSIRPNYFREADWSLDANTVRALLEAFGNELASQKKPEEPETPARDDGSKETPNDKE